jgi:hypothetical protein
MNDADVDFRRCCRHLAWNAIRGLSLAGCAVLAAAHAGGGCELAAGNLAISVRRVADDGFWGPTLEIAADDGVGPVNKYLGSEGRPLEACWWTDVDTTAGPELVVGLGPSSEQPAGALVLGWQDGVWQPRPLPPLPADSSAADYRFLVQNGALRAIPVSRSGGLPPPVPTWQWTADGWQPLSATAAHPP